MPKREQTTAHLFHDSPEVFSALREIRARTGTPVAVLLRTAVRSLLREHGFTIKSSAVRIAGGAR